MAVDQGGSIYTASRRCSAILICRSSPCATGGPRRCGVPDLPLDHVQDALAADRRWHLLILGHAKLLARAVGTDG
jgi:hypothetical protein